MLAAIKLSQGNKKVILVEKEVALGGAWASAKIDFIDGTALETACHLVEHYDDVYERISELSGVDFKVCRPQPVKILGNNHPKKYFSRINFLLELLQQTFHLITLLLIRISNFFLGSKIKRGSSLTPADLFEKIRIILVHRIHGMYKFKGIMEPEFGYQDFMERLESRISEANVVKIHDEFRDVHVLRDNQLRVTLESRQIKVKNLYLSESTEFRTDTNIASLIGARDSNKKKYWHIVIEVGIQTCRVIPTYIHFPGNQIFHRLTTDHYLNSSVGKNIFLLQSHIDPDLIREETIVEKIQGVFTSFKIFIRPVDITIHSVLEGEFYSSREKSMLYNSKSHEHIRIIPSIGDLARNFAINPLFRSD